eukprot:4113144-Pleurochrysis_carterae.AAC.1
MAEKAAEAAANGREGPRVRPGEGRRLTFEDTGPAGATARWNGDARADAGGGTRVERNVRSSLADEFGELRPRGAEALSAADVVCALERELGGAGRVTAALAEAAGRSAAAAALTSADSAPAIRAAAREWRA